jgi:hypothetical protein
MNNRIIAIQNITVGMECVEYRFYAVEHTFHKVINKTNYMYMKHAWQIHTQL